MPPKLRGLKPAGVGRAQLREGSGQGSCTRKGPPRAQKGGSGGRAAIGPRPRLRHLPLTLGGVAGPGAWLPGPRPSARIPRPRFLHEATPPGPRAGRRVMSRPLDTKSPAAHAGLPATARRGRGRRSFARRPQLQEPLARLLRCGSRLAGHSPRLPRPSRRSPAGNARPARRRDPGKPDGWRASALGGSEGSSVWGNPRGFPSS